MIENLPIYCVLTFSVTTLLTLVLFIWTIRSSHSAVTRNKVNYILAGLAVWLLLQALLSLNGNYAADTQSFPPTLLLLGIFPAFMTIVILFISAKGRAFLDSLPLRMLTLISIVRIPVELVLYWLFLHRAVPELMTFAGRNFDILAGISAPLIAYYGFVNMKFSRNVLFIWNIVSLGLLLNIVVNALLSAPSPIQQFAFDQPNMAILYFPFSWLPTFIVPIVLLSHVLFIRQIIKHAVVSR